MKRAALRMLFRLWWLVLLLLSPLLIGYTWCAIRTLGEPPLNVTREFFEWWWKHFKLGGL